MARRPPKVVLISIMAVLAVAGYGLYAYWSAGVEDDKHFASDETQLIVANTTEARLSLYKAGQDLDSAVPIDSFDGKSVWLGKGDYFLRADFAGDTSFYPINIEGYLGGPEKDGSLAVTIRPISEQPPSLVAG